MDTLQAFYRGQQARMNGNKLKIFDWDKAAELILEKGAKYAYAGLGGDYEYTGGTIFENGQPYYDDYVYLASIWATPNLVIDGEDIPCYFIDGEKNVDWDSDTKWPESALKILGL